MHRASHAQDWHGAKAWRDAALANLLAAGIRRKRSWWAIPPLHPTYFVKLRPVERQGQVTVPRSFISMASTVVWHSDS